MKLLDEWREHAKWAARSRYQPVLNVGLNVVRDHEPDAEPSDSANERAPKAEAASANARRGGGDGIPVPDKGSE